MKVSIGNRAVARVVLLIGIAMWSTGWALAQQPYIGDAAPPVLEVSIETSIKGRVEISQREAQALVMSSLENAGIREGLVFVSRDQERNRASTSDRDRSGYYAPLRRGERGQYARPTHRVRITFALERNVTSKSERSLLGDVLKSRLGRQSVDLSMRRVTETIFIRMRVNVFDVITATSSGAVPTIEAEAVSEILSNRQAQISHKERVRIWILEFPVKIVDHEIRAQRTNSPRGIQLSTEVIDRAGEQLAAKLKEVVLASQASASSVGNSGLGGTSPNSMRSMESRQEEQVNADSISQDRSSLTFSGDIYRLKVGDLLEVPVIPVSREPRVGEETHVYVKILRLGKAFAVGQVWDVVRDRATAVDRSFAIDARRQVRW